MFPPLCFDDCKGIVYSQNRFFRFSVREVALYMAKSVTPIDIHDGAGLWGNITQASPRSLHASHQVP